MARDVLTVVSIGAEGAQQTADITPQALVAANGFSVDNSSGKVLINITNGGVEQTLTVIAVDDPYGRSENLSVTVGANDTKVIGPFNKSLWNQTGELLHIDCATEDSLTLFAVKLA